MNYSNIKLLIPCLAIIICKSRTYFSISSNKNIKIVETQSEFINQTYHPKLNSITHENVDARFIFFALCYARVTLLQDVVVESRVDIHIQTYPSVVCQKLERKLLDVNKRLLHQFVTLSSTQYLSNKTFPIFSLSLCNPCYFS